jgi:CRISPR-associated protein Cas1
MKLFSRKKVRKSHFDEIKGGVTLNKEGKEVFLTALNKYFDQSIYYKGRQIKVNNIIQFDCHNLANRIIEEGD